MKKIIEQIWLPAGLLLLIVNGVASQYTVTLNAVNDTSAVIYASHSTLNLPPGVPVPSISDYACLDGAGGSAIQCVGNVQLPSGRAPPTAYWSGLSPGNKYTFQVKEVGGLSDTPDDVEFCTTGQLPPDNITVVEGVGSAVNVTIADPSSGNSDGFKVTYSSWDSGTSSWTSRGNVDLSRTAGSFSNEAAIPLTFSGYVYKFEAQAFDECGAALSTDNVTSYFGSRLSSPRLTLVFANAELVCVIYTSAAGATWTRMSLVKEGALIGTTFSQ
ncbi:uncharacterized protein LOC142355051, partial [Convolutriloba macropyga]|uniref:uncharacterized protein LOC142355051 n=1 Tax=Convolutriloba macropyga TaxID=536237 RepID=UPI003F522F51